MALLVAATAAAAGVYWPPQAGYVPDAAVFQDYEQLFARIAADRGLGHPYDEDLVRRLQRDSRIDHLADGFAEHLELVADLHRSTHEDVQMRFRVQDNRLVNLSAPARRVGDVMSLDRLREPLR